MRETTTRRARPLALVGAGFAALALIAGTATSAYAGTATGSGGVAVVTASHTNLSAGTGSTTVAIANSPVTGVSLSGAGYDGKDGDDNFAYGVYAIYGPKKSDYNTNSGWFYSAAWVAYNQITGPNGTGAGTWSGKTVNIAATYTATPVHGDPPQTVDCRYNWSAGPSDPSNAGKTKCYIHTFTAHGATPNLNDESLIEVHWS